MPFMTGQERQQLRQIENNAARKLHKVVVDETQGGFLVTVHTRYLDPEDTVIGQTSDEYVAKSNCEVFDRISAHIPPYVDAVQELAGAAQHADPRYVRPDPVAKSRAELRGDDRVSLVPDLDYVAELEQKLDRVLAERDELRNHLTPRAPIGEDQQD